MSLRTSIKLAVSIILSWSFLFNVVLLLQAKAAPADNSAAMADGHRRFNSGDYVEAAKSFQSATALNPSDPEAFYWLGRSYYEVPDYDKAVSAEQRAVALESRSSLYHQWLGRAYGGKADREHSFFTARKVKGEFEEAVRLNPSNIEARRDLEDFCIQAPGIVGGSRGEARAQVDAIATLDPAEGHLAQAVFQKDALKKPDEASAEYHAAVEAKPKRIEGYFEAASFFAAQNNPAELGAAIHAASEIEPKDPRLGFYQGVSAVLDKSDPARAEEYLKSYIATTPNRSDWPSHADAREWLGRLYESEGKTAQAVEQYRASLDLNPNQPEVRQRLKDLEKQLQ